jgi:SnoaL-like protein
MPSPIEDRFEIQQLMYLERHLWDNMDVQSWVGVFTEDGYFYDGSGLDIIGREALLSYAQEWCARYSGRYHMLEDPVVVVEGDSAGTHAYFLTFEGVTAAVIGSFDDEFVRTPDGWRIKRRVCTVFEPPGYPYATHELAAGLLDPRVGLDKRGQLDLKRPRSEAE